MELIKPSLSLPPPPPPSSLRELAARALRNLTPRDPVHMAGTVLPSLLPLVTTPDPSLRHGALHAVAELTFALYEHAQEKGSSLVALLGQQTVDSLVAIAPRVSLMGFFNTLIFPL